MAAGVRVSDEKRAECLRTLARTDSLAEVTRRHGVPHSTVISWLTHAKWQAFLDNARQAVAREIGRETERMAHDCAVALRGSIAACSRAVKAMLNMPEVPAREAAILTKALAATFGHLDRIGRLDRGEPTDRTEHSLDLSDSALDKEINLALSDASLSNFVRKHANQSH